MFDTPGTWRLAAPEAGSVLSTREPAALRDDLVRIAVTTMSAGSSTEPGGYLTPGTAQEQLSISDERSPAQVAAMLQAAGYDPVWKDAFPLVDVSPLVDVGPRVDVRVSTPVGDVRLP